MKKIKFAICGAGCRGASMTRNIISKLEGVEIAAVCDPYIEKAEKLANDIFEKHNYRPKIFTDHNEMFNEVNPDATFVATAWEYHAQVAIDAMKKHIPVALEVGGAYSIEECWELVDTYEQTKTPIMFMENCCFNKDELLALNMANAGLFGSIVYCHGAYRHDLRGEISTGEEKKHYRLRNYINRNCENYPTHELGPIAKILKINRGNRMTSLVSMSSKALGLHEYVQDKENLAKLKDVEFKQGDIVETLIKCENGELISLKLDTTLPTFYSREFTVRGTKGFYNQDNHMVFFDGDKEDWETAKVMKELHNNAEKYEKDYLPDYWKNITQEQLDAGHGGMDVFEFEAFMDCLKNNKEMPIDIYDAVSWMVISCLSEESIKNNGKPVEIPDFTRGKYKNR